jgi:hypothetical protein
MKRIALILAGGLALAAGSLSAAQPPATTFVAVLQPDDEVPLCAPATNAARGTFVAHVVDEATGMVEWTLIANNLPGNTTAAHIHVGVEGVAGPVIQPLPFTAGEENGVLAMGTFTSPTLLAALRENPENYYVNVHTGPAGEGCPPGVVRGQLNEHGPSN